MKKLIGIKCKERFFVSENYQNRYNSIENLLVDGKTPEKTFHPNWCVLDSEPVLIQKYVGQPDINYRYELIDKTMESEKTPLILNRDEVAIKEGYGWYWKDEYKIYQSLYKLFSDSQPAVLENVEFEYKTIMEVTEIREYEGFKYDTQRTTYQSDGIWDIREKEINHQLIDKIIFPEIVLPARPSTLTSQQSFGIIRQYIKQHINLDVATVTSDYNFCLTVKKKIPLSEPEKYTVDVNNAWYNKRKRKPKLETRYRRFREVECFNMAPKAYQTYSVISGFRGENQEDLKNNIDSYCENLIKFINEPVKDCPYCKGMGVVLKNKERKNGEG